MAKENNRESKLKIAHLLWVIIVMAVSVGVAWGVVVTRQGENSKAIERKVDKEYFDLYQKQQMQQFGSLESIMKDGFKGIDKRLERIENHKTGD